MRHLPFVMAFDAFNSTFCQLSVLGSVFILFLAELGLPKGQIGAVLSLVPFASMGAIFLAPLAARVGVKKVFVTAWATRNVFAAGTLLSPWVYWHYGAGAAFVYIVVMMAMFSLCRAFGDAANTQWRQEIIPHSIRGRFSAVDNIICTLAGMGALLVAAPVLASTTSIWRYIWLMAGGTLIGGASVLWAIRIPGGGEITRAKGVPFHVRRFGKVLRDRNFILYMIALSLVTFGSVPLGVFVPLYLKEMVGISPARIVLLQNGALAGTLLASYFWGWAADRFGSKPVILSGLCLLLVPPIGWILMPLGSPWSAPLTLAVYFVAGAASIGYGVGTTRQLYVTIVPVRRKTHYMSIFCAWMGAAGGLGQLLAGQSMDLAKGLTGHLFGLAISPYTCLFLFSILMLVIGLCLQHNVRSDGSISTGRFVGMFLQGNPLAAAEGLFRYGRAGRDDDRVRFLRRLGNSKSPLSTDELADALADPSFNVRYEAIVAIARSRPSPQLTSELIETLISGQPELSIEAAWALGRIGDPAVAAPLRWTFSSPSPLLALRSARALAALGDESIIPALQGRIAAEPDLAIRQAYASTLASMGKAAQKGLVQRRGKLRHWLTVKRLLAALADPDFNVRYEAIILTSHRRSDATLSAALVRILEDGEPDLRIEAALALGRMEDPSAIDSLRRAFDESDHPLLQARSARALAALGEKSIVPELRRRMGLPLDQGILIAYGSALGKLRAPHAPAELFKLLDAVPSRGWAGELNLALARQVDERGFIQLWRKMRREPGTSAARFLHGSLKRARRRPELPGAILTALAECIQAFGREDMAEGGRRLGQVLEMLPRNGLDKSLGTIVSHYAQRLGQDASGQIDDLPLAIVSLHAALAQQGAG